MSQKDRQRWNRKWAERAGPSRVNSFLREQRDGLGSGLALDVACGRGQNSIWLAQHGYCTVGVDLSRVALEQARVAAATEGVADRTLFVQADLDQWRPPRRSCDLVAIFRFLDRSLFKALRESVRPGGLVLYETRHLGVRARLPEATVAYLLRPGELKAVFAGWEILAYGEGPENARLLARKPARCS